MKIIIDTNLWISLLIGKRLLEMRALCNSNLVCFKGGLIDAWGRGTIRIIDTCKEAGLPEPELIERDGGFLVTLFKNNLNEEQLKKLGLNERQVYAILFYRSKGEITSSEYAERYKVSDRTARTDLTELAEKELLVKQGDYKTTKFHFR